LPDDSGGGNEEKAWLEALGPPELRLRGGEHKSIAQRSFKLYSKKAQYRMILDDQAVEAVGKVISENGGPYLGEERSGLPKAKKPQKKEWLCEVLNEQKMRLSGRDLKPTR